MSKPDRWLIVQLRKHRAHDLFLKTYLSASIAHCLLRNAEVAVMQIDENIFLLPGPLCTMLMAQYSKSLFKQRLKDLTMSLPLLRLLSKSVCRCVLLPARQMGFLKLPVFFHSKETLVFIIFIFLDPIPKWILCLSAPLVNISKTHLSLVAELLASTQSVLPFACKKALRVLLYDFTRLTHTVRGIVPLYSPSILSPGPFT